MCGRAVLEGCVCVRETEKGRWINCLPLPIIVHTLLFPKKGQPLNNGQTVYPLCDYYSEVVPLYVTHWLRETCI